MYVRIYICMYVCIQVSSSLEWCIHISDVANRLWNELCSVGWSRQRVFLRVFLLLASLREFLADVDIQWDARLEIVEEWKSIKEKHIATAVVAAAVATAPPSRQSRFMERNGRLGRQKRLNGLTSRNTTILPSPTRPRGCVRRVTRRPIISRYITFPHGDEWERKRRACPSQGHKWAAMNYKTS